MNIQTVLLRKLPYNVFVHVYREAAHQLLVKASDIADSDDKKRNLGEKAARRDPDFVCVHIRRSV